jgi:homoserine dehydrogenase
VKAIIAGYGVVGGEVIDRLEGQPSLGVQVSKVLVKDATKQRSIAPVRIITSPEEIGKNPYDLLVDLLPGTEVNLAYALAVNALSKGIPVVSANKALIATHGPKLHALAAQNKTQLLYGAAVGGGIDILGRLRNSHRADTIDSVDGIMNGTSNFIQTRMSEGMSYEQALKIAQEKGFAEADPTSDVSGKDAAYKLAILASKLAGGFVNVNDIALEGIDHLQPVDFEVAKEFGYVIKSLASYKMLPSGIEVKVGPALLPIRHQLGTTDNELNAFFYHTQQAGDFLLEGKGAGGKATASAVLSDIVSIQQGQTETWGDRIINHADTDNALVHGYLRCLSRDVPGTLHEITGVLKRHGINIGEFRQSRKYDTKHDEAGDLTPDFFLVDHASQKQLKAALKELAATDVIHGKPYFLRIEGGEHHAN